MAEFNYDDLDFYDEEFDSDEYNQEFTYFSIGQEIISYCIIPVIKQLIAGNLPNILLIIIWLMFHKIMSEIKCQYSNNVLHLLSAIFGFTIAYHSVGQSSYILLMPIFGVYSIMYLYDSLPVTHRHVPRGALVLAFCLLTQLSCEFGMDPIIWNRIRGIAMILAMKLISIGFDLDSVAIIVTPSIYEYLGYSLNLATIIFGPWSFTEFFRTASVYVKSLLFLLYSTCFTSYIFADDSYKWLLAYRDAQAFRFSHYFVCSLGQANINLFNLLSADEEDSHSFSMKQRKEFTVARASRIEVPRSLVEVVVNWNLPMHHWLKQYVFFPTRRFGSFVAVMSTYFASSLLHGINFQLSAVLLSLGIYTYTEHVVRQRLSEIYDACVGARSCRNCSHSNKTGLAIWMVNICFGLLSIFHLAYLGLMFDNSPEQAKGYSMGHTLSKWANLNYLSHIIAGVTFLFYLLIKR